MLVIDHLTKRFNGHTAVDDLSLSVPPCELYAHLWLNDADKSPASNCLRRFLKPDEGPVMFDGLEVRVETLETIRA